MRSYCCFLFLILSTFSICFAQNYDSKDNDQLEKLKNKFNQKNKIGLDSTLFYMKQLTLANNPAYKTYALAATQYLKTREKLPINHQLYQDSIATYILNIQETKNNFPILSDIYNLLANTHKRKRELKAALQAYEKAESYAIIADDIYRVVKIKGNIALIYQDMEALKEALQKMQLTKKIITNNKKALGKNYSSRKYKTLLNTAAIYNTLYKRNTKTQHYADSAYYNLQKILSDKELTLTPYRYGQTYYSLGTLYTIREDHKKAASFFDKGISFFLQMKANAYLYKSYYNSGVNYFREKDYQRSKLNFQNALRIKKDSSLDPIYVNTHKYLSEIYLDTQKADSALYYYNTYQKIYNIAVKAEGEEHKKLFTTDTENEFEQKIARLQKSNTQRIIAYNAIVISLLILLLCSGYLIRKNNTEKKKVKKRLQQLLSKQTTKEQTNKKNFTTNNSVAITNAQHEQIINGLLKIEKSLFFLRENFNLYNASKKIGTNTTYLSKVIKTHKKMSFSEYTNELRINYIVKKLMEDKKTRAYTTQAIGEIGGYKNAKSFTRIFKKYTGITPYQFIEKLNEEVL